jgi:hypothetical protein
MTVFKTGNLIDEATKLFFTAESDGILNSFLVYERMLNLYAVCFKISTQQLLC